MSQSEVLSALKNLSNQQEQIRNELRWLSHRELRELDQTITATVSLSPNQTWELYKKEGRAGEVIFGALSSFSTSFSMRIYVDDFTPIEFPKISDLLTAGDITPNGVLWVVNAGAGVYTMFGAFVFSFNNKVRIEAVNKGSSAGILASADILARLRPT